MLSLNHILSVSLPHWVLSEVMCLSFSLRHWVLSEVMCLFPYDTGSCQRSCVCFPATLGLVRGAVVWCFSTTLKKSREGADNREGVENREGTENRKGVGNKEGVVKGLRTGKGL